jgi:hypothetical protein
MQTVHVTNGSLTVTDGDNDFYPMKSATVRIEGDSNTFYYQNLNVSSSFLGTNVAVTNMKSVGELNLVGNASETEYEMALNSVIYVNT